MLKVRFWIGIVSAPMLIASVGCSISHRSFSTSQRAIPPQRLMSLARTFERQGHLAQAKNAYLQVLASQPGFPHAQQRLDTLIATETRRNSPATGLPAQLPRQPEPAMLAATVPAQIAQPPMPPAIAQTTSSTSPAESTPAMAILDSPAELDAIPDAPQFYDDTSTSAVAAAEVEIPLLDSIAADPVVMESAPSAFAEEALPDEGIVAAPQEVEEFFLPSVVETTADYSDLEQFLGPFHIDMVDELKEQREQILPRLVQMIADRRADREYRSRAAFLLGAIGPDAISALPVLHRELGNVDDAYFQVDVAESILKIQPENRQAIEVLVDCLEDGEPNVKWVAAFALRNAASPQTVFLVESLRMALRTEDLKLRRMVFLTLAEFGPAASAAIPELEAALQSGDSATRDVAKAALACIAPDRKSVSAIQPTSLRTETLLTE